MIKELTDNLTMKIVKIKDTWIEDVVIKYSSIADREQLKSMESSDIDKLLNNENIGVRWLDKKSQIFKDDELIAEWSHEYHIEECEDGLKIKIESWIK